MTDGCSPMETVTRDAAPRSARNTRKRLAFAPSMSIPCTCTKYAQSRQFNMCLISDVSRSPGRIGCQQSPGLVVDPCYITAVSVNDQGSYIYRRISEPEDYSQGSGGQNCSWAPKNTKLCQLIKKNACFPVEFFPWLLFFYSMWFVAWVIGDRARPNF